MLANYELLALFYIIWNIAAFMMVMVDKRRARRNNWRIPERSFFLMALAFGAVGILLGMRIFHHKTRHWSFLVVIPLLCMINLACGYLLWQFGWLRIFE